jgi:CheY-like chemotaxis protein
MRVVIAEDDPVSSSVLQKILVRLGHEYIATANGSEALEALARHEDVNAVISDWMMPRMDGLELIRRIRARKRFRYTYALLLTSRSGKQSYLEALDAGADDFITKPLDPDELRARLLVAQRILGLQEEMRQLQGLLAICCYCKKIREDESWVPVERYISKRADASFSHGICPTCYQTHFPE